jgi:hypothetical protein
MCIQQSKLGKNLFINDTCKYLWPFEDIVEMRKSLKMGGTPISATNFQA